MALIGLNITITGYAGKLIIVWKKNSAPLAEVGRSGSGGAAAISPTPDFPIDTIYTIADLQPVVYLIEFWRSDDGTTLDEFIKSWEVDASKGAIFSEEDFEYVVGRGDEGSDIDEVWADPEQGDIQLYDERLALSTHENTKVYSRGHGQYREDEITFNGTGFEPTSGVSLFNDGDTFFVRKLNKTDLQPAASSSSDYVDFKELKDDADNSIDFDTTFHNKLCYTNFSGSVGTIVFPAMASIPDCKVKFNCDGGSQNYLKLQFNASETVKFLNQNKNVIYVNKGGMVEFIIKSGVIRVGDRDTNELKRGSVHADFITKANTGAFVQALESTGVLNRDDYPGLYEYILLFPVGVAVTLAAWATDKTRWAIDTVAHTFRVPHLDNMYRRFRTGSENPGTYEADGVGEFTAEIAFPKGNSYTGNPNVIRMSNGAANPQDITGTFTMQTGNTETTVKAYKEIPLIWL